MSQSQRKSIISSDEDDDYELPSLSERVEAALKPQHTVEPVSSNHKNEDTKILKLPEKFPTRNCNTKLDFSMTSDSEDEEYELPNVTQRLHEIDTSNSQNRKYLQEESSDSDESFSHFEQRLSEIRTPKCQIRVSCHEANETDSDETFSNLAERLHEIHTPMAPNRVNRDEANESDSDESFSNIVERAREMRTPMTENKKYLQDKYTFQKQSSDGDEPVSHFKQKLSEMHTPKSPIRFSCHESSESDSDETFSNLAERLREMHTPKAPDRVSCDEANESDSDESFSNIVARAREMRTPMSENKENYRGAKESNSDKTFSNPAERIQEFRTPLSQNRIPNNLKNWRKTEKFSNIWSSCYEADESDSDESFSEFVETLHTPMSENRKKYYGRTKSDKGGSILNITGKQSAFYTPMSQRKVRRDSVLLPIIPENRRQCYSTNSLPNENDKSALNSLKVCKSENQKEFDALFPPETIDSRFLQNRTKYTRKLFEFFNRKIFSSKLPEDMLLIWDGSLTSTAGITALSRKNNVYSSSIKLSVKLLTSFDRLKNTLLHEMCHAAVWNLNKQSKINHGPLWQIWASRCKMILPFVECPVRCHNYEVAYRVWYQCPKCQWKKGRCKQVKKYQGAVCVKCKTRIIMTCT